MGAESGVGALGECRECDMWETWDMVKCDIWEGLLVFFVSIVACGKEFKCDKRERCLVFPWSVTSGTSQV